MQRMEVTLVAAGSSIWLPTNQLQNTFGIALAVTLDSAGNLTYKVQHTEDDTGQDFRLISISRAATTATVTDTDHRLRTNDSVIIAASGDANLDRPNGVDVTVTGVNTYTYTVANTGATVSASTCKAQSFRVFDHATMTGLIAAANGNYAFPVEAIRLNVTAFVAGKATLVVQQGIGV